RVREVRVILEADARPSGHTPATWLNLSVSGNVVSFVDVRFSHAALQEAVQTVNAVLLCCGGEFERSDSPSTALSLISNAALPLVSLLGLVILVIAVA